MNRDKEIVDIEKHVAIVSVRNTLLKKTGASEYLIGFAQSLSDAGFKVSIFFVEDIPSHAGRLRVLPEYRMKFDRYRMFKAIEFGKCLYSTDLRNWVRRAGRLLMPRLFSSKGRGFHFDRPHPKSLQWVCGQIAAIRPKLVVANYFNAAEIFEYLSSDTPKAILVHDVLALRAESFRASGAEIDFDLSLIDEEKSAFGKADICFAIKDEEAAYIRMVAPQVKTPVLPVTAQIGTTDLHAPRDAICIFVGGDNPSNRGGITWFLKEVWPRVIASRPGARLHIVGAIGLVIGRHDLPGVVIKGFVDDLDAEYAQASVAITPLLFGSGVKIKLIEGLAAGLPSVATSVGAEGVRKTSPEILKVEDGAEAFAAAIESIFAAPDPASLRDMARAFARQHYDQETVGVRIIQDALGDI